MKRALNAVIFAIITINTVFAENNVEYSVGRLASAIDKSDRSEPYALTSEGNNNPCTQTEWEHSKIPDGVMRQIYDEVKTPYKQGIVMKAHGNGKMVDCPSVFRVGSQWCMTYVMYDGRGYETWIAKSDDLIHWKTEGRLTQLPQGGNAWDKEQRGCFPALQDMEWGGSYELKKHQNRYWMSYIGSATSGYEGLPISIGLASTKKRPDKVHLWQTGKQPVMRYDDKDIKPWESRSPYKSIVYENDNGGLKIGNETTPQFFMFYNAAQKVGGRDVREKIGIAYSDDLQRWMRYDGNPVFQHDTRNTITGDAQITRMTVGNETFYVMFFYTAHCPLYTYSSYNSFAVSRDLIHWTEWRGEPLVFPTENYESRYAHKSFVMKHNGMVYHYYCAVTKDGQRTIALATSKPIYSHFLFAYFTGNATNQQQVHYAVSDNGLDFTPLNSGLPVIAADSISVSGGIRDPHILRGDDGWFRMVATMDWQQGKWSNRGIVMLRSRDLIHWEHRAIHFPARFAGRNAAKADAVWAPQTIYDPEAGKYMVYFSMHSQKSGPFPTDAVYYAYANDDFTDLTDNEPQRLFTFEGPTIDTDIVCDDQGLYHIFFNTWGSGSTGRRQFTGESLHHPEKWRLLPGLMQPEGMTMKSEGSSVYPLTIHPQHSTLNPQQWVLAYDCFADGVFHFCTTTDLEHFTLSRATKATGTFTPRHGSVIPITEQEFQMLKSTL
ncbi:MAG: hypothetical protein ACI4TW_08060 [Prevotella sp.]